MRIDHLEALVVTGIFLFHHKVLLISEKKLKKKYLQYM